MTNQVLKACDMVLISLTAVFFIACNRSKMVQDNSAQPMHSNIMQIELTDSLGKVNLSIPLRYDTNFSWVSTSDCGKSCDEQKYRFQPRALPVTKESGWIWLEEPKDSVERFTISHTKDIFFHNGDTTKDVARHNHLKEQLLSNSQNPALIFDTIQKINSRYFSIFEMEKSGTIYSKKVLAVTTIKNNVIKFNYELLTRKKDSITNNFIENSIDLIKTIQIEKGI